MAERYRDPSTGRFVTRSFWEELFATREQSFGTEEPEELEPGFRPNWLHNAVPYGQVWSTQYYEDGKPQGDIEELDPDALEEAEFPEGYSAYKVIYSVSGNPSYPRGYKSSDSLFHTQWPPPSADEMGADGIVAIRFY